MTLRRHKDLEVWRSAMELVVDLYRVTQSFPSDERFGLVSQIRRAAGSVPANIAEGSARKSTAELIQFLYISNGSLSELDTHLEIAERVGLLVPDSTRALLDNVQSQLLTVISSLKRRSR
jgi:four helix bundle protein